MRDDQAREQPAQSPDTVQAPAASRASTAASAADDLRPGAEARGPRPAGSAAPALPRRSPAAGAASRRLAAQRPHRTVLTYQRAVRHGTPGARERARLEAVRLLGGHPATRSADAARLEAAVAEASAVAAVIEAPRRQLLLAVDALFRGRFSQAAALVDTAWVDIERLGLLGLGSHALAVQALIHAHQGRRDALADASARFDAWRGDREDEVPIVRGLGHAVCELLHGAGEAARALLHQLHAGDGDGAGSGERSDTHHLCGPYGLTLLLDCVDGSAGRRDHAAISAHPAGRLPWNAFFVHLADAVLAGREGDARAAETALGQACAVAASYPPARHLGLGLVARTAARDGWGEPVRWLQEAELFYAAHGIQPAARHCRSQLRDLGERVRQRRTGSADVPERLWRLGVTVREFEVLTRLGRRHTNREIAAALHLSHRTVERHVANLLEKTQAANRRELAALLTPEPRDPVGAYG
ncbi:helix-turn-helix transcriptional regulator [Streptomyces sp. NBC_00448]|uniref:helix-turn-helix transcriptional regulator n=1 Tax=Streptomyces sp. NBC_00448 TaxID=2903652 RepID=UPI002E1B9F7B